MPRKSDSAGECVLIARLSAIGDVAMTIPAVYSACRSNPGTKFVMLTRAWMAGMFVDRPENLEIESPDLGGRHKGPLGMWRLARDIRRKWHITAFADIHNVIRTRLLGLFLRASGIRVATIDKGRSEKRRLIRCGAAAAAPLRPQIERYADVFRRLGLSMDVPFDGLWRGHATAPADCPAKTYIVVAPFAAHKGKIYPPDLMEKVIKGLADHGLDILIMGGGGEEQRQAEDWAARYPGVTSVAGKRLGFTRELELINHAAATLAMDSANMHLSALAGTPTISVWGATHPACGFAPWRQQEGIVQASMPCRPCSVYGNKPCRLARRPVCMDAIPPETIIETVLNLMKNG
ncbi:MAG: glycosyltransferase family 9 protein [Muribaculaceae bacterium]|nr:glycosyltransferase family 9 protein [Muribaculaceae bacterium]